MSSVQQIEFSVVVPSYNRAGLLGRALDSILEQSHPAREVIVVDDGSSDATAALVRRSYPTVRYCYQRHGGVSAARNTGIAASRCAWIALLDSDDQWRSDKLAEQAGWIGREPSLRWLHTNERWIRNGQPLNQKAQHRKSGGDIFVRCLERCCVSPSSVAIRRDVFEEFGAFDESLKACEDYDLWLRLSAHLRAGFVDKPLIIKHGGHPDQLSRRTPALDRYRIHALAKLLRHGRLSPVQARAASAELGRKAEIFVAGARKRGHHHDVATINAIVRESAHVRRT